MGANVGLQADVWSLGISAMEMAEMLPPRATYHPMKVLFMIPRCEPPSFERPERWTEEFRDFVRCCLTKDRTDRPSAEELFVRRLS